MVSGGTGVYSDPVYAGDPPAPSGLCITKTATVVDSSVSQFADPATWVVTNPCDGETLSRVALYARVSTLDKGQDPETQLLALREYAKRRGFRLVGEYVDHASGSRDDRPQYRALLAAAHKRQLDVVLVWRYDRFARSTQALVNALKEFQHLGVDFISYQENIDTTTPQGEMIFTVMASLAQFESALISERVKAGMVRAKAQGKPISRPPLPQAVQAQIASLYAQGTSINQIRKQLKISYGTAWNYVQRLAVPPQGANR